MSTPDYRATLNLPSTTFPMKASLSEREPLFLKEWKEANLYQLIRQTRRGSPPFILHDGPPYANGPIHLGHAVNQILKDITLRSRILLGFDASYIPGWDCHGLPIEINVEREHGKDIPSGQFRALCRNYAQTQLELQREGFLRLGALGDWDHPYTTMQPAYEAEVSRLIGQLAKQGVLFFHPRPVHFCLKCASALAEAELEYKDKTSHAIDVLFPSDDPSALFSRFKLNNPKHETAHFVIWTTTPWSLPANQALAVNPELTYRLFESEVHGAYLVLAEEAAERLESLWGLKLEPAGEAQKGEALQGLFAHHPFEDRKVPVFLGQHVSGLEGTGLVHTAGAHGEDDFALITAHDLKPLIVMDKTGHYLSGLKHFAGLNIFSAQERILELLKTQGRLLHHRLIEHSYPHCWRHKAPLIFFTTRQLFIDLEKNNLSQEALRVVDEEIKWQSDSDRRKMREILSKRPAWCISRQRLWGAPIPLFFKRDSLELHPDSFEISQRVAQSIEERGLEAWFASSKSDWIADPKDEYEQLFDVVDVWFDSGSSFQSVLEKREGTSQADLYLEGKDQFRGWFQAALWLSLLKNGKAPYKTLVVNGFTVDEQGRKMSKSLGNVIAPSEIIEELGADVLRLWTIQGDYTSDLVISEKTLKQSVDTYRKIRNTLRYLLSVISSLPSERELPDAQPLVLDRLILSKTNDFLQSVKARYETYQFSKLLSETYLFCSESLSGFYLDLIKDRLYTLPENAPERAAAVKTCFLVYKALSTALCPILPFTTEEAHKHAPKSSSPFLALQELFSHEDLAPLPPKESAFFEAFCFEQNSVRSQVLKALEVAKTEGTLKSLDEARLLLTLPQSLFDLPFKYLSELPLFFGVAEIDLIADPTLSERQVKIEIFKTEFSKCPRCWRYQTHDETHPCKACEGNLSSNPNARERRRFL